MVTVEMLKHVVRTVPVRGVSGLVSKSALMRDLSRQSGWSGQGASIHSRGLFMSSWRKASTTMGGDGATAPKDYDWVSPEAQTLIAKAYNRHRALADSGESYPPSLSVKDLEHGLGEPIHYKPKDFVDKVACNLMQFLRRFTHAFFRKVIEKESNDGANGRE